MIQFSFLAIRTGSIDACCGALRETSKLSQAYEIANQFKSVLSGNGQLSNTYQEEASVWIAQLTKIIKHEDLMPWYGLPFLLTLQGHIFRASKKWEDAFDVYKKSVNALEMIEDKHNSQKVALAAAYSNTAFIMSEIPAQKNNALAMQKQSAEYFDTRVLDAELTTEQAIDIAACLNGAAIAWRKTKTSNKDIILAAGYHQRAIQFLRAHEAADSEVLKNNAGITYSKSPKYEHLHLAFTTFLPLWQEQKRVGNKRLVSPYYLSDVIVKLVAHHLKLEKKYHLEGKNKEGASEERKKSIEFLNIFYESTRWARLSIQENSEPLSPYPEFYRIKAEARILRLEAAMLRQQILGDLSGPNCSAPTEGDIQEKLYAVDEQCKKWLLCCDGAQRESVGSIEAPRLRLKAKLSACDEPILFFNKLLPKSFLQHEALVGVSEKNRLFSEIPYFLTCIPRGLPRFLTRKV